MMVRIDVIICTRNNQNIITKCLESVGKQTIKDFNCIVVDDNSTDDTLFLIKKEFPWVKIIEKKRQTGPAESRNIAIKRTSSKFIATLDSDVQLDKNWLNEQIKLMENDKTIGIAASKILYSWNNNIINSCGGGMTKLGFGFDRLSGENANSGTEKKQVLYGHSAAMLVRREMINKIGDFDSTYFYGSEDTDFGWRANIAGWNVVFNPKALAYHDENSTIKKMRHQVAFHGTKNRVRSILKNYSTISIIKYLPFHITLVCGKAIISEQGATRIKALLWNIWNLNSTFSERIKVQNSRKISDYEIRLLFSRQIYKKTNSIFAP